MQDIIHSIKTTLVLNKFPALTILANVFFGLALGKILTMPGNELVGSALVKTLLIIGTCLFANYLMCLRKAFRGITRNPNNGKLRPFLKEAVHCAMINASAFLLSIMLFIIKPHFL